MNRLSKYLWLLVFILVSHVNVLIAQRMTSDVAMAFTSILNDYRKAHHLKELVFSSDLLRAAEKHTIYMSDHKKFSHYEEIDSLKSPYLRIANICENQYCYSVENIGLVSMTGSAAPNAKELAYKYFQNWMKSIHGHREALLDTLIEEMAFCISSDKAAYYATFIGARKLSTGCECSYKNPELYKKKALITDNKIINNYLLEFKKTLSDSIIKLSDKKMQAIDCNGISINQIEHAASPKIIEQHIYKTCKKTIEVAHTNISKTNYRLHLYQKDDLLIKLKKDVIDTIEMLEKLSLNSSNNDYQYFIIDIKESEMKNIYTVTLIKF